MSREFEDKVITQRNTKSVSCDICGYKKNTSENYDLNGIFIYIDWIAGYGTEFDNTRYQIDICVFCIDKIYNKNIFQVDLND